MKTFIPVSSITDNEDDVFIFSRIVKNPEPAEYYLKKNQKYYAIFILYKCVEKLSITIVCNILNDMFSIKLIILRSELNDATFRICMDATFFGMSHLKNFLLINATYRSKISSDQKRLFFAVSP